MADGHEHLSHLFVEDRSADEEFRRSAAILPMAERTVGSSVPDHEDASDVPLWDLTRVKRRDQVDGEIVRLPDVSEVSPRRGRRPTACPHELVASHATRPGYAQAVLEVGVVALGVSDVHRAAQFWSEALGYTLREDGFGGWARVLMPPGDVGTPIAPQLSETPAQAHPRLHFDLHVADPGEQNSEAARLVALGARRVDWTAIRRTRTSSCWKIPTGEPVLHR